MILMVTLCPYNSLNYRANGKRGDMLESVNLFGADSIEGAINTVSSKR